MMIPWDLLTRLLGVLLALAMCWGITQTIQPSQEPPKYWYGETERMSSMPPPTGSWTSFIWSKQDSLWTDSVIWADEIRIELK